jgi:phosphatidylserine decarboxylase
MARTLTYRDRETGELLVERVFGDGALDFLYGRWPGRLLTDRVLSSRTANRLYGVRQRAGASRARIPRFVSSLGIDASEAELPIEAYASLDDFFTRRLKPGARPIDRDPAHLVSPADGRALAWPHLEGARLAVKGSRLSVRDLVADDALAAMVPDPCALVVRLAPADYHRVHFPDDGVASPLFTAGSRLHSVHPIALEAGAPSFANHRTITRFDSDGFGPMVLVDVGALLVGTIVETYRPGLVGRGEEKGYFRFGGSTVVLLARGDRVAFDDDLLAATAQGVESRVRVGMRVGRRRG